MKVQAKAYLEDKTYNFPLGKVDRDIIHIGSITLSRNNGSGQISEAQAKTLLAEAIMQGAEIVIKFDEVEITLNKLDNIKTPEAMPFVYRNNTGVEVAVWENDTTLTITYLPDEAVVLLTEEEIDGVIAALKRGKRALNGL